MMGEVESKTKKWTVTFLELRTEEGKKYKVTRILKDTTVTETKVFETKEMVEIQYTEWL